MDPPKLNFSISDIAATSQLQKTFNACKTEAVGILITQYRFNLFGPIYCNYWVIPDQTTLIFRVIRSVHKIFYSGWIGKCKKAVSKTLWHVEAFSVLTRQNIFCKVPKFGEYSLRSTTTSVFHLQLLRRFVTLCPI